MKITKLNLYISLCLIAISYSANSFADTPNITKEGTEKSHANKSIHWGYSGSEGPEFWGGLSDKFKTCSAGSNQSPIDIKSSVLDANLPPIKFNYNMLTPTSEFINNGHTVQVNIWSGGEITVDNINFKLKQFHFHTPSENKINGQSYPMEAHFVHLSDDNKITVVAVVFSPGADDPTLKKLWDKLPMKTGDSNKLDSQTLKPLEFDKNLTDYYRFNGSLTTPPCSEGVRWIVMKQPFHVSKAQVEKLQLALKQPNNRPIQPINARIILE